MSTNHVFTAAAGHHTTSISKDPEANGTPLPLHVAAKLEKIDNLFDESTRQKCTHCVSKRVSWSCSNCDRHLPNGKWADLGLTSEDEGESLVGHLRQVVQSGLVKDEGKYSSTYVQAKFALKYWIMLGDATARPKLPFVKEWQFSFEPQGWRWANAELSAEDGPASIMDVLRSLSTSGSIHPATSLGWARFAINTTKGLDIVESVLVKSMTQVPLPAAVAEELKRHCISISDSQLPPAVAEGLCKSVDLSVAESGFQPPDNSEVGKIMLSQGCSPSQALLASSLPSESFTIDEQPTSEISTPEFDKKDTPRFTVGPPSKKYLKEVAKAVEANNKHLEQEQAQKELEKKDRKAKKDEAAARKARAQEDQRKARERKAEQRKQRKLREQKQAKIQKPRRSLQDAPANPVVRKQHAEESLEAVELESIEGALAVVVPHSLDTSLEVAHETAAAPSPENDGGFETSHPDSNTLIEESALSSATMTCDIDTTDCQCDECKNYDLAIDMLAGGQPEETPPRPENVTEILSPKPRAYRSASLLNRIEQLTSSFSINESDISSGQASNDTFAYQHDLLDALMEGARSKSTLNVRAPPFVPKADARLSEKPLHTVRIPSNSELPNWVELGLAAEAVDDSLFSRVSQLRSLGCLTHEDEKAFGSVISKLWRQIYLATQDKSHMLKAMSFPRGSGSWCWADFQFSAEDREDSIFGVTKKLASLGFWSTYDERALHNLTMTIAKKWLLASSEEDVPSTVGSQPALPVVTSGKLTRESQVPPSLTSPQQVYSFASGRQALLSTTERYGARGQDPTVCQPVQGAGGVYPTSPLPGIYRDGKMVASEADLFVFQQPWWSHLQYARSGEIPRLNS